MVLKLLHEYTTTYRGVAGIRMLNTHYPDTDEQIRTILKPCQLGNYQYENTVLSYYISTLLLCIKPIKPYLLANYQYENTVLSYYISTLLLCIKPNLSHATIACTVIMYYYKYTVLIPTGKRSYQK